MIVELCVHGEAKPHVLLPGDEPITSPMCHGGRVLEQAIIIERDADGIWPEWALRNELWSNWAVIATLDALASAQEKTK